MNKQNDSLKELFKLINKYEKLKVEMSEVKEKLSENLKNQSLDQSLKKIMFDSLQDKPTTNSISEVVN